MRSKKKEAESMKKRLMKKLHKKNLVIANEISSKMNIDEKQILVVQDGVVQLDFNNPKHVETYEKWIED